ncbi:ATP-binding cassette domain-containing protein [Treponema sp. Marseille-Q3903]|nr:ATP-binding cassette domain-containing protein [Treponema sp. Marseille-Q3903]
MRENSLNSVVRRKKYSPEVYARRKALKETVPANVLNRNFYSPIPRTIFVTDITYLYTSDGVYYLNIIEDLYNREVVAWKIGASPDSYLGMIFQHFNLMPSRNVFDNVAFPLKYSCLSKKLISEKVHQLLELVEIDEKAKNYPDQLSGGQKQRVAIARVLANDPDILLCDEATSALDTTTTRSILKLLKNLNKELNLTIVIITHQMEVIKDICQHVAVMENGVIVEQNSVFNIFANPHSEVIKRFIRATSNLTKIDQMIAEDSPVIHLQHGEMIVRFSYVKKDVLEPLISATSRLYDITMNIIFLAACEKIT